jgi:hypothetical protein
MSPAIDHFQRNSLASSCFSVSRMASRTLNVGGGDLEVEFGVLLDVGVLVALGSTTAPFAAGSGCTVVMR